MLIFLNLKKKILIISKKNIGFSLNPLKFLCIFFSSYSSILQRKQFTIISKGLLKTIFFLEVTVFFSKKLAFLRVDSKNNSKFQKVIEQKLLVETMSNSEVQYFFE
jgi:hypothetical protein